MSETAAVTMKGQAEPGTGNRVLRATILLVVAIELGFVVFLTMFLWNHANPKGDGMEMVGASLAFMGIFLPFSLPAFIFAKENRYLVIAAVLAAAGALLYFGLWFQLLDEMGLQAAPWK